MVHVTRTSSILTVAALVAVAASSVEGVTFNCPGINYNIRAGADWATPENKCKPASQIASELKILKSYTSVLRLYSLTDCEQATAVVPAAIAAGFQLELGLWVDSYDTSYKAEKEAFATLLNTGVVTPANIVGIHVGSEAIYRGNVNYQTAVSHLSEIRQMCIDNGGAAKIPLTITDVGNTYLAYPSLIDVVDYVSANLFPFWDHIVPAKAAAYFLMTYERLVRLAATRAGNKSVVIGETGWATNGTAARASQATPENSAKYFHDFYLQAQEKGIKYYYFSAFDEPWKGTDTVEAYFGLFHEDGKMKPNIETLELDRPKSTVAPQATIAPESTVAPQTTAAPHGTVTQESTKTPESTVSAQSKSTVAPEPTQTLEATVTPEATVTAPTTAAPESTVTKSTAAPEPTAASQSTEAPQSTAAPKSTVTLESTEALNLTVTPEPTSAPQSTVTPEPTAAPKSTEAPESTAAPKSTVTKSTAAPEPTAASQSTEAPQSTAASKSTVTPEATQTTAAPKSTVTPEATVTAPTTAAPESAPNSTVAPHATVTQESTVTPQSTVALESTSTSESTVTPDGAHPTTLVVEASEAASNGRSSGSIAITTAPATVNKNCAMI